MKFCFQFLDLLDRDIFNISFNEWYIVKHIVDSSNSLLIISDQVIKLITGTFTSNKIIGIKNCLKLIIVNVMLCFFILF